MFVFSQSETHTHTLKLLFRKQRDRGVMPANESRGLFPARNLPVDCKTVWHRACFSKKRFPSIIHSQRSLFFSHAHTRFVLCLRKGIYLWKRAISKTLRSAEWLKGAEWCKQKNQKNVRFQREREQRINKKKTLVIVVCQREFSFAKIVDKFPNQVRKGVSPSGSTSVVEPDFTKTNHPTYEPARKTLIILTKMSKIQPYKSKQICTTARFARARVQPKREF